MAGESFTRNRDGFRFVFGGMRTNDAADILPPEKYPYAQNIRAYNHNSIRTRPGQALRFVTGGARITDINTYASLGTDNLPRILARDVNDAIWLDTPTQIGTLAAGGPGAVMIPFRPNQSVNPYMYIANGADYQKFSAPGTFQFVSKVGIAEPPSQVEAAPLPQTFVEVLSPGGNWNTGGTASGWSDGDRSNDIVVTALPDPALPPLGGGPGSPVPARWSVQVSPTVQYQRGEIVMFNGSVPLTTIIEDVLPPLSIPMVVQAIYYRTDGSHSAVVMLQGITSAGNVKNVANQSGQVTAPDGVIAQLSRGSLIMIGTDTVYVQSVTTGPDNSIAIEAIVPSGHASGDSVTGLPVIVVNGVQDASTLSPGTPIIGDQGNVESFSVAAGVGTLTSGPPGGGPTGTIIATAISTLNGWGGNAHVGAYEMGTAQNFGWGLDPSTTSGYNNPGNVGDGNDSTYADATGQHTHTYYGSIWTFNPASPQSGMVLNILSEVLADGEDGLVNNKRSAGIWYSLDNGTTWIQIYNQGQDFGGPRSKQWDSIPLPASQDITHVQVMGFTDSHDDMVHRVFTINISAGAASIGINTGAFQVSDYLHFSVNVSSIENLVELKLQFDVSDGTFSSNYYYASVRPSDLVPVAQDTVTQMGAVQAVMQETAIAAGGQTQNMQLSFPTVAGESQWSEIWLPISGLTRIGGDPTKTLATINAVQVLVNASNTVVVSFSSIAFVGTGQPDVGDIGEPYRYRVRPRSSLTGAIGNPSPDMRYGAAARRQQVQLNLPSPSYDLQIDTWDIFRWGGSVTQWRYIGSTSSIDAHFIDNYDDNAAQAGDALDFDNFEPWPSIDVPFDEAASTIIGYVAEVTLTNPGNVLRFLPGNLIRFNGTYVYTLRSRPTLLANGNYFFEFDETVTGILNQGQFLVPTFPMNIYEPAIARQFLPYMWGPDVNGTVFACGDPLRLGTFYFAKGNNPDSAPDSFNQELCPPSEPLMGGIVVDGLSYIASPQRWWALYPQANEAQRYNPVQQPIARGVVAPYAITTDGKSIYFWAKDGIWSNEGSLTDDDLYNLFPHEGVDGQAQTYGTPPIGRTLQPPDYSRCGTFRLTYSTGYIYATYQDATNNFNTLVYDVESKAWSVDVYGTQVPVFCQPAQQAGTLVTSTTLYPSLLMADIIGRVLEQQDLTNDAGTPIFCSVARFEFDGGDNRAPKQWGDMFVDGTISTATGVTVTPMSLGIPAATAVVIPNGASRQRVPLAVNTAVTPQPIVSDFLGAFFQWTDDFSTQTDATVLRIWQPSFAIQPAPTIQFTTFGTSFALEGYGHIGWISLAWISTNPITIQITTFDGQSPSPFIVPSSAGVYQKALFRVSANKGQLFRLSATSVAPFQIFMDDTEIKVGQWQRNGPYVNPRTFEEPIVDGAPL